MWIAGWFFDSNVCFLDSDSGPGTPSCSGEGDRGTPKLLSDGGSIAVSGWVMRQVRATVRSSLFTGTFSLTSW